MELSARNLSALNIPVPAYDRSQIGIGIVHFGVGGFHRAHQAMYLDRLLSDGLARDWGSAASACCRATGACATCCAPRTISTR